MSMCSWFKNVIVAPFVSSARWADLWWSFYSIWDMVNSKIRKTNNQSSVLQLGSGRCHAQWRTERNRFVSPSGKSINRATRVSHSQALVFLTSLLRNIVNSSQNPKVECLSWGYGQEWTPFEWNIRSSHLNWIRVMWTSRGGVFLCLTSRQQLNPLSSMVCHLIFVFSHTV